MKLLAFFYSASDAAGEQMDVVRRAFSYFHIRTKFASGIQGSLLCGTEGVCFYVMSRF